MFGGYGFYVDGLFMVLVIENQFYLKIDDVMCECFVVVGCEFFSYVIRIGECQVMSYYCLFEEVLELLLLMLLWVWMVFEVVLCVVNVKVVKKLVVWKKVLVIKKFVVKKVVVGCG